MNPEAARNEQWDAIVIGTGMGGAATGWSLARAGWKVLFCEQGNSLLDPDTTFKGDYAEQFARQHRINPAALLAQSGRWSSPIWDDSKGDAKPFTPFIGAGTGGSTALYGMVLERFIPQDFSPASRHPADIGSTLPEHWPIEYNDLVPYYQQVENQFQVNGTPDPLKNDSPNTCAPPAMTTANQELFEHFSRCGLHPYRPPIACKQQINCKGCQGYLCDQDCKLDSCKVYLLPAIRDYGAALLTNCKVLKLQSSPDEVKEVICQAADAELILKAKTIILAAGALATPQILLNSNSDAWPNGLANTSGLVGKNLMRHQIDLYAVFTKHAPENHRNLKEFAFSDWNTENGENLGTVQSFGPMPPPSVIAAEMTADLESAAPKWLSRLSQPFISLASRGVAKILARTTVLAATLEDLPYLENQVLTAPNGDLHLHYCVHDYEHRRMKRFNDRIKSNLTPYRYLHIRQAENNKRIAHVCGTCRFGEDPATSVLDANNRAHGLENLYVVDSSFFPSSGGTNPALTIAANALRVADQLRNNR